MFGALKKAFGGKAGELNVIAQKLGLRVEDFI